MKNCGLVKRFVRQTRAVQPVTAKADINVGVELGSGCKEGGRGRKRVREERKGEGVWEGEAGVMEGSGRTIAC